LPSIYHPYGWQRKATRPACQQQAGSGQRLSHQVGGFLGAWLGGYLFERTGSYDCLRYIDIMLAIGAALIHLPIKEVPKLRPALAT
jgi:predicted MFS family arabinose efflux permease